MPKMANPNRNYHNLRTPRGRPRPKPAIFFPRKLQFLFRPKRYKVLHGGRGGAKSWGIARALIIKALEGKELILCAREFQNSIAESVHRLLEEQINAMGFGAAFDVQQKTITCKQTGSEFIFAGLRKDVQKIKSTEGITICWVEEAEKVSAHSWEVLIPTIRRQGSEIWISFNPEDETDPTSQKFLVNPPPDSVVQEINWQDNPWFPETLRKEKDYLYRVDADAAEHVWGGRFNTRSDAQIFKGKCILEDFEPHETWNGPYFGQDFGFSTDPAATVKMWINGTRLYIEHEAVGLGLTNDDMAQLIKAIPGADQHILRADSSRPETIVEMQNRDLKMVACKKWTGCVEDGIQYLRSFEQIVIHPRCKNQWMEARLYKYKIDKLSGDVLPIIIDKHNHGWDAIRYGLEPMIVNLREEIVVVDAAEGIQISSELDDAEMEFAFNTF
jgi:phage terminase large subunit